VIEEKNRTLVAFHESGHAIVAIFTPGNYIIKLIFTIPLYETQSYMYIVLQNNSKYRFIDGFSMFTLCNSKSTKIFCRNFHYFLSLMKKETYSGGKIDSFILRSLM